MEVFLALIVRGIAIGGLYSLLGLPIVVMLKAMRVFNFAVGVLVMFLAWITWSFNVQVGLPFWLSVVVTMGIAVTLGILTERLILRYLVGMGLFLYVITLLNMGNIFTSIVLLLWGTHEGEVYPDFIRAGAVRLGPIVLSQQHITFLIAAVVIITLFTLFFRYTRPGLAMRAVSEDQQVTQAMGIKVTSIMRNVTILAYVMAGSVGILFGTINGIHVYLADVMLIAMVVVFMGGMDSVVGVLAAGPIIGVTEQLAGRFLDPLVGGGGGLVQLTPYLLLILVVVFRPSGLFGSKIIERI